jgi:hypothetical protein
MPRRVIRNGLEFEGDISTRRAGPSATPVTGPTIDSQTAKIVAENFINTMQGFNNLKVANVNTMYKSDTKNVACYEVILSQNNKEVGYVIVGAYENEDLPIIEFSNEEKSHYSRFKKQLNRADFKMIRFSTNYVTAEDNNGKLLHEIGNRIIPYPAGMEIKLKGKDSSEFQKPKKAKKPYEIPSTYLPKIPFKDYNEVKKAIIDNPSLYKRSLKLTKPKIKKMWNCFKFIFPGGVPSGVSSEIYSAVGWTNHTNFNQICPNTPPNNNDHYSGCGA